MGGFLACILAGAAMSIQGVMNTRLSEHIGTMETNAFVQCVAAALSLLVLVFWRTAALPRWAPRRNTAGSAVCWRWPSRSRSCSAWADSARRSPWRRSSSRSFLRAAAIDAFGIMGTEKLAFGWSKWAGLALMTGGVLLFKMK